MEKDANKILRLEEFLNEAYKKKSSLSDVDINLDLDKIVIDVSYASNMSDFFRGATKSLELLGIPCDIELEKVFITNKDNVDFENFNFERCNEYMANIAENVIVSLKKYSFSVGVESLKYEIEVLKLIGTFFGILSSIDILGYTVNNLDDNITMVEIKEDNNYLQGINITFEKILEIVLLKVNAYVAYKEGLQDFENEKQNLKIVARNYKQTKLGIDEQDVYNTQHRMESAKKYVDIKKKEFDEIDKMDRDFFSDIIKRHNHGHDFFITENIGR